MYYCSIRFVCVHCKEGKVNLALSVEINFCYIPHYILLCDLSPRNFFTILFFFLAEAFFLDIQSCSIMFSLVLQEADIYRLKKKERIHISIQWNSPGR